MITLLENIYQYFFLFFGFQNEILVSGLKSTNDMIELLKLLWDIVKLIFKN